MHFLIVLLTCSVWDSKVTYQTFCIAWASAKQALSSVGTVLQLFVERMAAEQIKQCSVSMWHCSWLLLKHQRWARIVIKGFSHHDIKKWVFVCCKWIYSRRCFTLQVYICLCIWLLLINVVLSLITEQL